MENQLGEITENITIADAEQTNCDQDEDIDEEYQPNSSYNLPGYILNDESEWEEVIYPNNNNEDCFCAVSWDLQLYSVNKILLVFGWSSYLKKDSRKRPNLDLNLSEDQYP